MSSTLKSTVLAQIGWAWRDQSGALPIVDANRLESKAELENGTDAGRANAVWHVENRPLAQGAVETFYLDALTSTLFDNTITISLSNVRAVLIVNRSTDGGTLLVGGAPVDAWHAPFGDASDRVRVMPGSPLLLAATSQGWEVGETSSALQIQASGGDAAFDIAVLGVRATESTPSSDSSSSASA